MLKFLPWVIAGVALYFLYQAKQPQIQQATTYASLDAQLHQTAFSIANLVGAFKSAIANPPAQ